MGLFVEKKVAEAGALTEAVTSALSASPTDADDPAKVAATVAAVQAAGEVSYLYKWGRIILGLAIGAGLLAAGIFLGAYADSWAAEQALKAATTPGYVAPVSSLPGISTSIIALGSAWSGGLVGVVLNEKSS
jgi:hypothetical protein